MAGNPDDGEDILQEAFLGMIKGYSGFRGESSVYTWMYRIVANTGMRFNRNGREAPIAIFARNEGIPEETMLRKICSVNDTEDTALEAVTRESCLQMFMNCMPAKYRAVYTLRQILHFSVRETATILEIGESLVKTRLHRANTITRNHLEGRCSLINQGAPCNCRGYAGYLEIHDRTEKLLDIRAIRTEERRASERFRKELTLVRDITALSDTRIEGPRYGAFMARMQQLCRENGLRILEAV